MEKEITIEDSSFPSHITKTKIEGEWWLLTNKEDDKKIFNPNTNISSEWYSHKNCVIKTGRLLEEKNILWLEYYNSGNYNNCFININTGKSFNFDLYDDEQQRWFKLDEKLKTLTFVKQTNYPTFLLQLRKYYKIIYNLDTMEVLSQNNY